ncbi:hypothetical protein [Paenibacillus naphthalenovorans]|uniref:hypothetical protein n=1 Tax=Paenibacillus naphthalenovorans TaxID=162209 RepID=UPI003D2DD8B2
MIFSFDFYDHDNPQLWSKLEETLPADYTLLDPSFLQSLEPTMPVESFIENCGIPGPWDGEETFWISVLERLPQTYSIPDLTLLKRLFES